MNTQHRLTDEFLNSFDSADRIHKAIILDSGCGDCYASNLLATYGAELVIAHDPYIAPPTILRPSVKHIKYMTPLCDTYNIIWSHHVIEHVDSPVYYLTELRDQLKESGELWLGCPNTANNHVFSDGHIHNFTLGNLMLCLQRAMFDTKSMKWWTTDGQLRVRIRKRGECSWPLEFHTAFASNKHFDITKLPTKKEW